MAGYIAVKLFIGKTEQTFDQGEYELVNIEPDHTDTGELAQVTMYGSIGSDKGEQVVVPYWVLNRDAVEQIATIYNQYRK